VSEHETALSANSEHHLPVLPLRNVVVFPHMVIPLFVGREKSIEALDAASAADKRIVLAAQTSHEGDEPSAEDIHSVGTIATILQLLMFDQYVKMNKKVPPEVLSTLSGVEDPDRLADMIATQMSLRVDEKQSILEIFIAKERLEHLLNLMNASTT